MARKSMAELQAEHDAAMADLAEQMKLEIKKRDGVIANLEGLVSNGKASVVRLEKHLADERADNDSLRDQLFEATQELARRAGYMQAIEDAQPPALVAAPKASRALDANAAQVLDRLQYAPQYHYDGASDVLRPRWYHARRA